MKIFSDVTINIFWGMILHFSRLYISLVVMGGKMYNLEKCLNLCNQMLIVIQVSWQGLARPRLWIAKGCISHRIGLEAPLCPFRYYYTTKLLKVACSVF